MQHIDLEITILELKIELILTAPLTTDMLPTEDVPTQRKKSLPQEITNP